MITCFPLFLTHCFYLTGSRGGAIGKKAGNHHYMTPPLTTRHNTVSIRSPASSPNLSVRSALSSPPTIKIEDSVLEFTDSASDTDLPANESDSSPSAIQHRVFQLPPVNSWVPKGESLFTSILDSRSPQIYRRTTQSSKTSSYPPSPQNGIQGSRVSWPQASLQQHAEFETSVSDSASVESSKQGQIAKSPKLLTKCTSFDLERSKPFPQRSSMTSPMLRRKHLCIEESDTALKPEDQGNKISDNEMSKLDAERIILEDEKGKARKSEAMTVPICESVATTSHTPTSIESIAGDNAVKYLVMSTADGFDASKINESLEDPTIPETDILDDVYHETTTLETQDITVKGLTVQSVKNVTDQPTKDKTVKKSKVNIFSSDKEKGAKLKKSKSSEINGHFEGKSSPKSDKVSKNSKEKLKITTVESGTKDKSKSSLKDRHSEKSRSRTPAATVRSALLTSAAKLKSIGRRSPVTLLSYKSHSISIPDHSRRPNSASEVDSSSESRTSKIHQTESSPTILVTSHEVKPVAEGECKEILRKMRSATPPLNKTPSTKRQLGQTSGGPPSLSSVQSLKKSSTVKTKEPSVTKTKSMPASVISEEKSKKTRSATSVVKSTIGKQVKGSSSQPSPTEKQRKNERTSQNSLASKGHRSSTDSSVSVSGRKVSKQDLSASKEEKLKVKHGTKRGSISSVNSDSSKHTDHFRDCCHGRRKTDKK